MTTARKAFKAWIETTGTTAKRFFVLKTNGKVVEYPTRAAAKMWLESGEVVLTEKQAREQGLIE